MWHIWGLTWVRKWVTQLCPTLCDPMDYTWNSPGQNTGVDSCFLLQGIFPTQESNPGLPHCKWILYQLSQKGCPRIQEWVACLFSSRSSRPRNWTGVSCRKTGKINAESVGGHKTEARCILVSNRYSMYYLLFIIPATVFVVVLSCFSLISYTGDYDLQFTVMDHLFLQHLKCCDLNVLHAGSKLESWVLVHILLCLWINGFTLYPFSACAVFIFMNIVTMFCRNSHSKNENNCNTLASMSQPSLERLNDCVVLYTNELER